MITSKQIIEKYFDTKNISGKDVVVYINPTLDELKSLKARYFRFIADAKTKKVYVWDGYLAIHTNLSNSLIGMTFTSSNPPPNFLVGEAQLWTGATKLSINDLTYHFKERKELARFCSYRWDWLDNYFSDIKKYVDNFRYRYEKKKEEDKYNKL